MKKDFQREIAKYHAEAENFDSADGLYSGYAGESNGYAGEQNNADGMQMSQSGDVFSRISDGERNYTVVITNTNTSGAAINAIVFGADLYSGATQENAGVTVTVQESTHARVRAASQRSPFWVNGIRYITTTNSQMTSQVPKIWRKSSAGGDQSFPFIPLRYRTSYNNITTQIDAPDLKFLVDGATYWEVPVIANETVTIVFQLGGRWDAAKVVQGKSPVEVANQSKLVSGIGGSWR